MEMETKTKPEYKKDKVVAVTSFSALNKDSTNDNVVEGKMMDKSSNIFGNEQQMRRFSLTQDETSVVADEVGNGNATTEDAKKNRKKKDKENEKKVGEKPLAKKVPNHVSKIQEDLAKHKEGGERKQREEKEKLKKELEERLRKKERIKH
ncbi:hypothetical protein Tco_0024483 [Tanacetum coccineum]